MRFLVLPSSSPHPGPSSAFENVTFELRCEDWGGTSHGNYEERELLWEEMQKSRSGGRGSFQGQQESRVVRVQWPRNEGCATSSCWGPGCQWPCGHFSVYVCCRPTDWGWVGRGDMMWLVWRRSGACFMEDRLLWSWRDQSHQDVTVIQGEMVAPSSRWMQTEWILLYLEGWAEAGYVLAGLCGVDRRRRMGNGFFFFFFF